MRQVLLSNPKEIKIIDIDIKEVPPGWVLIKTICCGICGTDAHSYMGETIFGKVFPFNIGHEVCGHIEKVGSDISVFKENDLVVINPFFTCNSCKSCYMDLSNNCENKTTIGLKGPGGYSEYILVPETSTYKVRADMNAYRLSFAEPLANIIFAMDKLKFDNTKTVLINGVGAIGLMFLQLIVGQNPQSITICDFNESKLNKAITLGANRAINPAKEKDSSCYDIIIDCTGSTSCVEQSLDKLAFGGVLMNFGVCPADSKMQVNPFALYRKSATIMSSFALNKSSMQKAVTLLEGNTFNTDILIDSIQPLEKLEECLIKMANGETSGKIIINTTI